MPESSSMEWKVGQNLLSRSLSTYRMLFMKPSTASSLVVIQEDAFLAELLLDDLILCNEVVDDLLLFAIEPAGQGDQKQRPGL